MKPKVMKLKEWFPYTHPVWVVYLRDRHFSQPTIVSVQQTFELALREALTYVKWIALEGKCDE